MTMLGSLTPGMRGKAKEANRSLVKIQTKQQLRVVVVVVINILDNTTLQLLFKYKVINREVDFYNDVTQNRWNRALCLELNIVLRVP